MFNFCSLYSGSSGNSLLVQTTNTKILIDAGESAKKIVEALSSVNIDVNDLDAIIVTHEHSDHVKGLGTLSKNITFLYMLIKNMECYARTRNKNIRYK